MNWNSAARSLKRFFEHLVFLSGLSTHLAQAKISRSTYFLLLVKAARLNLASEFAFTEIYKICRVIFPRVVFF